MKKKYISPTVIVKYISMENILGWSIFIDDDTPNPGIQGDAKKATIIVDDSEDYDDLDESEGLNPNYFNTLFL